MNRKTPILLIYTLLFFVFINTSFISCSQDEELIDLVGLDPKEEPKDPIKDGTDEEPETDPADGADEVDNGPDFDSGEGLKINTTPCDFLLSEATGNSTIEIDCQMDLKGQTITLPAGITLSYNGGEIINGTLNFSGQGIIDGNLLNKDLEIEGDVLLSSPDFMFYPERWDIVQGKVDDTQALSNRNSIESLFNLVHGLQGKKFMIDKLDAYFKVDGYLKDGVPEVHAINLPSDFHLALTDEVHIRMQPNGHFRPVLISIYNENNVTLTGGSFYGDRETHFYNSGFVDSDGTTSSTHEWVKTMAIKGGKNIVIEGVNFIEAGVGLAIGGIYHYNDSRHISSENIHLRYNRFLRARQTNLVITSGREIYIENNELIDGGIDMPNSKGTAPSSNLNFEPFRGSDSSGGLIEYERVDHIYIRNNKQMVTDPIANPRAGQFQFSHGNGPIIVENNEMINTGISFTTVEGLIIRNNTIENGSIAAGAATNTNRTEVVYGNEIYNNKIINTNGVAVNIAGNGVVFRDNQVEGNVGIALGAGSTNKDLGLSNSIIKGNTIIGHNRGIVTSNSISNVLIEDNNVSMKSGSTFAFVITNSWDNPTPSHFEIKLNSITGTKAGTESGAPASLFGANDVVVMNNSIGEIQINGGSKMIFEGNTIEGTLGSHGMKIMADTPNSVISKNNIIYYASGSPLVRECIFITDGINLSNVQILDNECIER